MRFRSTVYDKRNPGSWSPATAGAREARMWKKGKTTERRATVMVPRWRRYALTQVKDFDGANCQINLQKFRGDQIRADINSGPLSVPKRAGPVLNPVPKAPRSGPFLFRQPFVAVR